MRILQKRGEIMLPGRRLLLENQSPISLLESCTAIQQGLQIHAQIILNGLCHHIFSLSRLISFFALSGSCGLDHSRLLFSQIHQPNIFIWNTMIRGYSRSESPQQSILLYKSMIVESITSPNNFTFPFLVNSCARLSNVKSGHIIHTHIVKYGFESDVFVQNSLIHLYSFFGELDHARRVFGESCDRDLVSYNTMINGYARGGRPTDAFHLFGELRVSGIMPDEFTIVALLSACSVLNDLKIGKQIHLLKYKNTSIDDSNIVLMSALVDMYAKCGVMDMADRVFRTMGTRKSATAWSSMVAGHAKCGEIEIAHRLFDEMPGRDLVSWTAMIGGYSQMGQYKKALELFAEMQGVGLEPDEVTMVAVLSACAQLGALEFGKKLHQDIKNRLFDHNAILSAAIVDMYAKCGSIESALDVFHGVEQISKTVGLFNSMISGLAQHGHSKKAMVLLRDIELMGLRPDGVTFVGILCACSHRGLIEEGKRLFDSMYKEYRIKPQIEHYGCMVDLLSRGGFLKEALEFIEKMPVEANSVIWGSLLGACKIHGHVEMAEIASKRLRRVDPDHDGRCIMLYNIYASANRWEDSKRVRQIMEDGGIRKPAGWSCIEFDGSLHQFLANDKSHPQTKEINLMLEEMAKRLRSAGYVPDTTQVLFDVDEEEKENMVSHHSEKLALAFGLISLEPEATIRIVKNLRICGDCHSSFKLLSQIFTRDIVVRDRIRFHHLKNGLCSCKDYW